MTIFKKLIRENSWFWSGFGVLLAAGALLLFSINTGDEIIFFSDRRTKFLNLFFAWWTKMGEWFPFVAAGLILLFVKIRHTIFVALIGGAVTIVSYLLKTYFSQPRPRLFFEAENLLDRLNFVEGVKVFSGNTSFPSGHTMAAFALFSFLAFLAPRKSWAGIIFLSCALLVGISRIYLVQHFLKDVYLGAILGTLIATLFYFLEQRVQQQKRPWANTSWRSQTRERAAA